jgi:parvulin-like peptidyl-prolyl isomerase
MPLLLDAVNIPPPSRARLEASADERKSFAEDIRQMLAAAEQARAEGLAERPDLKLQLGLSRSFVLAQTYFRQQRAAGAGTAAQTVTQAEMDALLKEPGSEQRFALFVEDYQSTRLGQPPVTEAQRAELRQQWARVMVGERKAVAAGLDRDRTTQLALMIQQAQMLASAYTRRLGKSFEPTDAEVDAYVARHPELDSRALREKAEKLLQRARAGEDFAALAREASDDPGSKTQGGSLGWFGRGMMVKPFEDATFALKPGELSVVVESQFGYHVIKLEERRAAGASGGGEEVRASHILIAFPRGANDSGPPMSPRERARAAVEEEKRERVLNELVARSRVVVPDDYPTTAAPTPPAATPSAPTRRTTATPSGAAPTKPTSTPPARRPARRRP